MAFDLLLADEESPSRVLEALPDAALACAPEPERREPSTLSLPGHSDDLRAERWGVIVPDSPAGEQLLAWLRPLCELRSRQCGLSSADELPTFRVARGMTRPQAQAWRADFQRRHPAVRPGYLVIAGDLAEVSLELQQELAVCASVGRLCFTAPDSDQPDGAGYQAYCKKLIEIEADRERWNDDPQMLFYASQDGSAAAATGYHDLVRHAYDDARAEREIRWAAEPQLFGSADDHQWYAPDGDAEAQSRTLLHWATGPHPAVLLSLTHGLGVMDRHGQRLRQGALVIQEAAGRQRTEVLDHEFFQRAFLPGGFWFLKACFGAGTPAGSVFEHWLAMLRETERGSTDPKDALKYLATADSPFIARIPQVALARGDGPLGILAHVDLDWTYGAEALDDATTTGTREDHGPYYDVLRMVACGHRFGPALAGLTDEAQALGSELALLYGDAEIRVAADDPERRRQRAWTWMRYLDLSGYILLGDPAAQLPIRAVVASVQDGTPPPGITVTERAVIDYLQQQKPPEQIAREAGIAVPTLERWVAAYQDAGRRALAALVPPGGNPR